MKVLIIKNPTTLKAVSPDQVEKIRQASGNGEVVLAPSRLESLEHLADAEVVFGMLEREDFLRAPGLRWIHSATSGLDRFLHPEMFPQWRERAGRGAPGRSCLCPPSLH